MIHWYKCYIGCIGPIRLEEVEQPQVTNAGTDFKPSVIITAHWSTLPTLPTQAKGVDVGVEQSRECEVTNLHSSLQSMHIIEL